MDPSREEQWDTGTNPRHLVRMTRKRPNGRKYTLLVCAIVRHLMSGPHWEIPLRVLDELERFAVAQPAKGVRTNLWREVVRRNVPQIPDPLPRPRSATFGGGWFDEFARRLNAMSQVSTPAVNVILNLAFDETEENARRNAEREVSELTARLAPAPTRGHLGWLRSLLGSGTPPKPAPVLTIPELRDEVVSRFVPERRDRAGLLWIGITDVALARQRAQFLVHERVEQRMDEAKARAVELIREVFPNPYRPLNVDTGWSVWNHGAVKHIAEQIVATGNFTDLPILADALEDAGCSDEHLLRHCREPHNHVPGCWALDAVLGRW